jgi:hypothetical protein
MPQVRIIISLVVQTFVQGWCTTFFSSRYINVFSHMNSLAPVRFLIFFILQAKICVTYLENNVTMKQIEL